MKIYVPEDNTYNKCYVLQSEGVIRGYNTVPSNNTNYSYRDYYIKTDYYYRDGTGTWSNYTTLPVCLDDSVITNDYWYRIDITNTLICFFIIAIVGLYFPFRIFKALFGKRLA